MSTPRCVVIGTGRVAGGFIAPLLDSAGWECVLVGRDREVISGIRGGEGIWLREGDGSRKDRWVRVGAAIQQEADDLDRAVIGADLLATAVGPSALRAVGRRVAGALGARMDRTAAPMNIITFENHRRAPELLAEGLMSAEGSLAAEIGRGLGVGGAAAWRAISRRAVTFAGVRYDADDVEECYIDGAALAANAPPLDGSLPGVELVHCFDDRMVEKLWTFNAGHAAAAYFGWLAGTSTLDEAMARRHVRDAVVSVVKEAQVAFQARLATRPFSPPIACRSVDSIVGRYAQPALGDPVARVAREPRRKLAPCDRLIGAAMACLAAGIRPDFLAAAAAAALAYANPGDRQAVDLQREVELVGPQEVLATVSMLDPSDELSTLISTRYLNQTAEAVAS